MFPSTAETERIALWMKPSFNALFSWNYFGMTLAYSEFYRPLGTELLVVFSEILVVKGIGTEPSVLICFPS